MNSSKYFLILISLFALASCATMSVPLNNKATPSGAGVNVSINPPIALFSYDAEALYFAKIESNGEPSNNNFIRSSFANNGRVYLLNALPGEYVIVGTFHSAGVHRYTSYLSKDAIEKTKFVVREGEFTFIGKLLIDTFTGLSDLDALQIRYSNLISPGGIGVGLLSADHHYKSEIIEFNNNIDLKKKFFENAKNDLKGGGWNTILQ